ncbi:MAG TPA: hypothetical protein VH394_12530 [Thermoanaerobaculia bacterium]|jgi:hypothetical protein|nr:hypothetical protein [Thermoanaerobaculia bacterium]
MLILSSSFAGAETFDLYFYRYCKPGTLCGHASEQAYQQYICQAVEEMNLIWEPNGISFRPVVMPVDGTSPTNTAGLPMGKDKYYQNPGCRDDDTYEPLRVHWRENVAQANPTAISMMLTGLQTTCCSGIPRTFKNLEKAYGIYCDANVNRGPISNGRLWAHEMGHHWCLPHTHSKWNDSADGQNPAYDSDAPVAKACSQWNANGDAVGCGKDQDCIDQGLGTCSLTDDLLPVGDTPADRLWFEVCKRQCVNDPDKAKCSTDSDCGAGQGPCKCAPGADEDENGNLVNGHTWFASKSSVRDIVGTSVNISQGSPHATWCDVQIKDQTGGMTLGSDTMPSVEVTVRDIMSYHKGTCSGPYVRSGIRQEAFTPDQLARIAECRQKIKPRDAVHLPDVCANHGGDHDHDGLCDSDDNCRYDRNTCQTDSDADGRGDVCDLCPQDPAPTGDLDGDGIGDACDNDKDGDGCFNDADDHPDQSQLPTYTTVFFGCPTEFDIGFVSDAADTDGDGVPNCEDPDDDNDGLCDSPGPGCKAVGDTCPEVVGSCSKAVSSGPCPPSWFTCGGRCAELVLKANAVINPDPTRELVFEQIWMVNRTLFAAPLRGKTAAESVIAIAQKTMGGASTSGGALAAVKAAPERLRLEIWQRPREGGERLVAIVGEYDAAHLRLGELVRGGLLRLRPTMDATGAPMLEVATTYGVGIDAAREARDRDGDGIPDLIDNCLLAQNASQIDADHDGFGNACDADLDADGLVDADDLSRIEACQGADLTVEIPVLEPETFDGEPLGELLPEPRSVATVPPASCAAADFDGNRRVDKADTRYAAGMLGRAPGPSAVDRSIRPLAPSSNPSAPTRKGTSSRRR